MKTNKIEKALTNPFDSIYDEEVTSSDIMLKSQRSTDLKLGKQLIVERIKTETDIPKIQQIPSMRKRTTLEDELIRREYDSPRMMSKSILIPNHSKKSLY